MAETLLHLDIRSLLRTLAQVWLAEQGVTALTLSDQFVYWIEGDEKKNLAPDLLVIPGALPTRTVASWKTWEEDHAPTFAMEIVSEDIDKDYVAGPPLYDELGIDELVIYDPLVPPKGRTRRVRWQVYRRSGGAWSKVIETNAACIESEALGCWLREVVVDGQRRARLATGPEGEALVPTPQEAALARAEAATREAEANGRRVRELEQEIERLRAALRSRSDG